MPPDSPCPDPTSGEIERVAPDDVRVLLTAAEASPHFESLFLGAREQITAGFAFLIPKPGCIPTPPAPLAKHGST